MSLAKIKHTQIIIQTSQYFCLILTKSWNLTDFHTSPPYEISHQFADTCLQTVLKICEHARTHSIIIYTTLPYNLPIIIMNTPLNMDVVHLKVQFIYCYRPPVYRIYTLFTHRHDASQYKQLMKQHTIHFTLRNLILLSSHWPNIATLQSCINYIPL